MDKISDIKLELIGEIEKGEKYVRELDNVLKIPKSTVSDKLKELYEQNIIDFKIEGRNKLYFMKNSLEAKNYIIIYENYKLLKLIETYPKLRSIVEDLRTHTKSELIVLFGSYAKFSAGDKSDIDIYIEGSNKILKEEIKLINSKISVKIGKFKKDSDLGKEIIANHIILQNIERFYSLIVK